MPLVCPRLADGGATAAYNSRIRMRPLPQPSVLLSVLLPALLLVPLAAAQQPTPTPTLTVESNLVEVPALVTTKHHDVVFTLTASDFALTDDGVPQRLTLVPDTDSQPLALAVVVETGGAGASHLADYTHLDAILDALIGHVPHRVALIAFDSTPHLILPFTPSTDLIAGQLMRLQPGDPGAAILDAVAFAVRMLSQQPPQYRRALLLLSETIDQGSFTSSNQALQLISDTNTTMYAFAFSSTRAAVAHEASKFSRPDEPGPAHGCFSRDHTGDPGDDEYNGHYSRQVLDCISDLAPPLRLATMAFLAAHNALRTNTAASIAHLTGGEFLHFHDAKDLQTGLIRVSNDVPNFYVLSFHPSAPTPGLHVLRLTLPNHSDLVVHARTEYWIDNPTP